MPSASTVSVQNNFTAGLKTEFTGLNFPENAATDTDNCVYDLPGDVTRRLGFDYEANFQLNTINRTGKALSTYRWRNVNGDGSTELLVSQVGGTLYFYTSSAATINDPLSQQKLGSTVDITSFLVLGSSFDPTIMECEYSDGNGYLFVYNPYCEPFYVQYNAGTLTASQIQVQIRDFAGLPEGADVTAIRPATLTDQHQYNLVNQGWTSAAAWTATSGSPAFVPTLGPHTIVVQSGITLTIGQAVNIYGYHNGQQYLLMTGNVTAYSGTSMTINITAVVGPHDPTVTNILIVPTNTGYISSWFTDLGTYPSNSDVWWRFKDQDDVFDPATTIDNVTLNTGNAPKGHYTLAAFNMQRDAASGITSVPDVITNLRPRTGTWFQGRVWYTGVDASVPINGIAGSYSWAENIYFSQIVSDFTTFGLCYQTNDPTSEDLFDLLPTDGGVISIQGCGKIYKLFPIQNGMLVFAANGIWFITGSQGIGFAANDYTITKISQVQSISSTSFVNVQGLPYFWNEEGIYTITPAQQGLGLTVEPLTVSTILTFYNDIPVISKQYVRGDYDPINYIVTFLYRDTQETGITNRYEFNRCLNFNVYNKAFYPYTLTGTPHVNGINYVSYPGAATAPDPGFKYLTSIPASGSYNFTFSEERDEDYVDFESSGTGTNYISFFVTGYRLAGQAQRKFQDGYVYMYSRNDTDTAYRIQSRWDFANSGDSGRWSSLQLIQNHKPNFGMIFRRHRLRGQGYVGQIYVQSVDGEPFDIMGWSVWETQNSGV